MPPFRNPDCSLSSGPGHANCVRAADRLPNERGWIGRLFPSQLADQHGRGAVEACVQGIGLGRFLLVPSPRQPGTRTRNRLGGGSGRWCWPQRRGPLAGGHGPSSCPKGLGGRGARDPSADAPCTLARGAHPRRAVAAAPAAAHAGVLRIIQACWQWQSRSASAAGANPSPKQHLTGLPPRQAPRRGCERHLLCLSARWPPAGAPPPAAHPFLRMDGRESTPFLQVLSEAPGSVPASSDGYIATHSSSSQPVYMSPLGPRGHPAAHVLPTLPGRNERLERLRDHPKASSPFPGQT